MPNYFTAQQLQKCLDVITRIPISEVKYYLLLTLNSLKTADAEKYQNFLNELTHLSNQLIYFVSASKSNASDKTLMEITQSYQRLYKYSEIDTASRCSYALLNLGATLLSVFTGVLGGIIGSVAGITRSIWELRNPLSFLKDGAITGFAVGAAMGFRTPKKIFKEKLTRQLTFCMHRLEECFLHLQEPDAKPFSYYQQQVEEKLVQECFAGDQESYQRFLQQKQTFQIATFSAQFISEDLEGYLGQHACIILSLPNQNKPELIEFSLGESDVINRHSTAREKRIVTGEKIVEMMAFHQKLQETQRCTYSYIFTKMKAGENDCFRYIEKILLCTGQKTTTLQRFNGSENWIGKNVVGFFVKNMSPFRQDILEEELDKELTLYS